MDRHPNCSCDSSPSRHGLSQPQGYLFSPWFKLGKLFSKRPHSRDPSPHIVVPIDTSRTTVHSSFLSEKQEKCISETPAQPRRMKKPPPLHHSISAPALKQRSSILCSPNRILRFDDAKPSSQADAPSQKQDLASRQKSTWKRKLSMRRLKPPPSSPPATTCDLPDDSVSTSSTIRFAPTAAASLPRPSANASSSPVESRKQVPRIVTEIGVPILPRSAPPSPSSPPRLFPPPPPKRESATTEEDLPSPSPVSTISMSPVSHKSMSMSTDSFFSSDGVGGRSKWAEQHPWNDRRRGNMNKVARLLGGLPEGLDYPNEVGDLRLRAVEPPSLRSRSSPRRHSIAPPKRASLSLSATIGSIPSLFRSASQTMRPSDASQSPPQSPLPIGNKTDKSSPSPKSDRQRCRPSVKIDCVEDEEGAGDQFEDDDSSSAASSARSKPISPITFLPPSPVRAIKANSQVFTPLTPLPEQGTAAGLTVRVSRTSVDSPPRRDKWGSASADTATKGGSGSNLGRSRNGKGNGTGALRGSLFLAPRPRSISCTPSRHHSLQPPPSQTTSRTDSDGLGGAAISSSPQPFQGETFVPLRPTWSDQSDRPPDSKSASGRMSLTSADAADGDGDLHAWTGQWNQADMQRVIKRLRQLKS